MRYCEMCGRIEKDPDVVELGCNDATQVKLHEYWNHAFCPECLIVLLLDVVEQISEWSPKDAEGVINETVRDCSNQAARLMWYRSEVK